MAEEEHTCQDINSLHLTRFVGTREGLWVDGPAVWGSPGIHSCHMLETFLTSVPLSHCPAVQSCENSSCFLYPGVQRKGNFQLRWEVGAGKGAGDPTL